MQFKKLRVYETIFFKTLGHNVNILEQENILIKGYQNMKEHTE